MTVGFTFESIFCTKRAESDTAPQVGLACLALDASHLSWVAAEVRGMLLQLTHPEKDQLAPS